MAAISAPADQPHVAAAALPSVIGGPGSAFIRFYFPFHFNPPIGPKARKVNFSALVFVFFREGLHPGISAVGVDLSFCEKRPLLILEVHQLSRNGDYPRWRVLTPRHD
jgi:hypothetical protein